MMPTPKTNGSRSKAASKVSVRAPSKGSDWTFLTNHAHVLLCLARDRDALMKDVAASIGITERAVQRIVSDLEASGYVERERDGRRNRYSVRAELPLRHPIEGHRKVESLLSLVGARASGRRASSATRKLARN